VGLKEAALDSPTFRATSTHFSDQVDLLERWLDEYVKSASRLVTEYSSLEKVTSSYAAHALLPTSISETILDHDYTFLTMKKYGEGVKEFWTNTLAVMKKLIPTTIEPIAAFLHQDLRSFKVGSLPVNVGIWSAELC
jgi:hypothetical protein